MGFIDEALTHDRHKKLIIPIIALVASQPPTL